MSGAIRISYDLISLAPISAIYTRTILIIARTGIDFGALGAILPVTQFSVPSDIRNRRTRPFDPGKLGHSVYTMIATPPTKPEPGRIIYTPNKEHRRMSTRSNKEQVV